MSLEHLPAPFMLDVVGCTAVGKSDFALQMALAKMGGAELVCLDSRTIYTSMDIGTAKPDEAARQQVPHHLLDIAEPTTRLGLREFGDAAQAAITDILSRGKIPILVGGAGIFRHVVLDSPQIPTLIRTGQEFANASTAELVGALGQKTPYAPFRLDDRESLLRHLAVYPTPERSALRMGALTLGIEMDRAALIERIQHRTAEMLASGLEQEVRSLVETYGWSDVLSTTIGYKEFAPYFDGQISIDEVAEAITSNTIRLANRQRTWFKREPDITWVMTNGGS